MHFRGKTRKMKKAEHRLTFHEAPRMHSMDAQERLLMRMHAVETQSPRPCAEFAIHRCQYIRGHREANSVLGRLQLVGGHLARLVVANHFVAKLLALDDVAHAGALDGRDVDENVG